jgi:hypothetical protein
MIVCSQIWLIGLTFKGTNHPERAICHEGGNGLEGADVIIDLEVVGPDISHAARKRFPHLAGCTSMKLPSSADVKVPFKSVNGHASMISQLPDKKTLHQRIIPISAAFSRDGLSGYCILGSDKRRTHNPNDCEPA